MAKDADAFLAELEAEMGSLDDAPAPATPGSWIDPARPRVEVARFPVIGATFATGSKSTLRLTLIVEREHKMAGMKVTDWEGVQLECTFVRALTPGEEGDGE